MGLIIPVVLLGLLASLSPSTLIVFILLLETTRARVNASTFLIGWFVSLTVVFSASYVLGTFTPLQRGSAGRAVDVLEALMGAVLVGVAVRHWLRRNRPSRDDGVSRNLERRLKALSPWGAGVLGVLKQPWVLTAAAAIVVVQHHSALVIVVIAFAVFAVVSTATVGLIFAYYAREPGEAQARLALLRARVLRAGPVLVAGVTALVGVVLMVDGLLGLTGLART